MGEVWGLVKRIDGFFCSCKDSIRKTSYTSCPQFIGQSFLIPPRIGLQPEYQGADRLFKNIIFNCLLRIRETFNWNGYREPKLTERKGGVKLTFLPQPGTAEISGSRLWQAISHPPLAVAAFPRIHVQVKFKVENEALVSTRIEEGFSH